MTRARQLIALAIVFVAMACNSGTSTPTNPIPSGGVYAPVCVSFAVLIDRINDFKSLDLATATVEDVKFAGRQVVGAYREFRSQLKNSVEGIAQLDAVTEQLNAAAASLPPGSTAQEAVTSLNDDLDAFLAALATVNSSLGCPFPSFAP